MRIAILCGGSAVFGMEVISLNLARALRARGHEVHFLVSGWTDGEFARRLSSDSLPFERIFLGKISKSLKPKALYWTASALMHLPRARRHVRDYLRRVNPDVIIVSHRDWVLQLRSVLRAKPVVLHVHELPPPTALMKRAYRQIDQTVDAFAAVSGNIAERLRGLGIAEKKTHIVRNGIEVPETRSRSVAHALAPTIGIIGQIGGWKGHEDLIVALGILNSQGQPFRCSVFGSGDDAYVSTLKKTATSYGIRDRITWHGYVRDPNSIYADLDVCVIPSRFDDPFPTVAIEAAMCGLPVVAARRGGLPEIVIDEKTGLLIDSENPPQLAHALGRLLGDSGLRERMGHSARARAMELFTTDRMTDRMEALLCRLALSTAST